MHVAYCARCTCHQLALLEGTGQPTVRRFPSGVVAVFLACGHTAPVTGLKQIA